NQRGFGVVAKTKAVADARSNGDDIFERTAELDSEHIRAGINTENRAIEEHLDPVGSSQIAAGSHNCSRNLACHLDGEGWAGQSSAFGPRSGLGQDTTHGETGLILDTFGDADDRPGKIAQRPCYLPKSFRGHSNHHTFNACNCGAWIAFQL